MSSAFPFRADIATCVRTSGSCSILKRRVRPLAVKFQAIDDLVDNLALGAHGKAYQVEIDASHCPHRLAVGAVDQDRLTDQRQIFGARTIFVRLADTLRKSGRDARCQERSHVQLLPRFEVGPDRDRDLGIEWHGCSSVIPGCAVRRRPQMCNCTSGNLFLSNRDSTMRNCALGFAATRRPGMTDSLEHDGVELNQRMTSTYLSPLAVRLRGEVGLSLRCQRVARTRAR